MTARAEMLSESAFQKQVIDLAHQFGWTVAHFRAALSQKGRWLTPLQGDAKGFPDLVLLKPPSLIFAELKAERGVLSDEQAAWISRLAQVPGVKAVIWKPRDWDDIVTELRRAA